MLLPLPPLVASVRLLIQLGWALAWNSAFFYYDRGNGAWRQCTVPRKYESQDEVNGAKKDQQLRLSCHCVYNMLSICGWCLVEGKWQLGYRNMDYVLCFQSMYNQEEIIHNISLESWSWALPLRGLGRSVITRYIPELKAAIVKIAVR